MNIGILVSNPTLLCGSILGLAIVGYMGYKAVEWIASKLELVTKTDTVACATLSPQATNGVPSGSAAAQSSQPRAIKPAMRAAPAQTDNSQARAKIRQQAQALFDGPQQKLEEHEKIVTSPQSVDTHLAKEYKGKNDRVTKICQRLKSIQNHYGLNTIYSVRGNGNCFCNAAVAGLLSTSDRAELAVILEKNRNIDGEYIAKDPGIAEENPNKDLDFEIVRIGLEGLKSSADLLKHEKFTAAFSRVIRYILSREATGVECLAINGENIEPESILHLNKIFGVNASAVVLTGKSIDSEESHITFVANKGGLVLFNLKTQPKSKTDFLIVYVSGHYIALTR